MTCLQQAGETFLRLLGRLPEAEQYRSDHYRVYEWLPREPSCSRERRGGELE